MPCLAHITLATGCRARSIPGPCRLKIVNRRRRKAGAIYRCGLLPRARRRARRGGMGSAWRPFRDSDGGSIFTKSHFAQHCWQLVVRRCGRRRTLLGRPPGRVFGRMRCKVRDRLGRHMSSIVFPTRWTAIGCIRPASPRHTVVCPGWVDTFFSWPGVSARCECSWRSHSFFWLDVGPSRPSVADLGLLQCALVGSLIGLMPGRWADCAGAGRTLLGTSSGLTVLVGLPGDKRCGFVRRLHLMNRSADPLVCARRSPLKRVPELSAVCESWPNHVDVRRLVPA